jgi:hypothetical protein
MARPPRIIRAQAWYHVTARGIERKPIFVSDRYGDWGRDLALYLGQRRCGIKLKALGELVGGIDYGSVSGAIRRLEQRALHDKSIRKLLHEAVRQIEND